MPRELISGNGDQVVWKQNMKTMMHDLVDSMFDETDLYDNIQRLFHGTQMHRNAQIYQMITETMKFDSLIVEENHTNDILAAVEEVDVESAEGDVANKFENEAPEIHVVEENIEHKPGVDAETEELNVADFILTDDGAWVE